VTPGVALRLAWALWLLALGLLAAGVAIAVPALAATSEELGIVLAFGAVGALLFGPVGAFLAAPSAQPGRLAARRLRRAHGVPLVLDRLPR
jgi:hypothetical protein